MAGYTKLFADIVTSTIWQAPNDARVLWISLLALKGKDNICRATIPALAKMCDITLETCEKYLADFQGPDKYSRSQEHDGRRIQAVDGGFLLLNGEKYQSLLQREDRTEYVRKKVAEHRARKRVNKSVTESKQVSPSSPSISPAPTPDTSPSPRENTDARAEAGLAPDQGTPITPDPVMRECPVDLAPSLRAVWKEIAKDHSPEVATKARDACRRIFGAVTEKRMRETLVATHKRQATAMPADQWPDFTQQIRNDKAGLIGTSQEAIDPEREAQREAFLKRKAKEIIHVDS